MDTGRSKLRSAYPRVSRSEDIQLGVGTRKLSKRKKPKASVKGHKEKRKDHVPARAVKEADAMETSVLVVFWGVVIIIAEIAKWIAAFHFAKYLPWVSKFMGGH